MLNEDGLMKCGVGRSLKLNAEGSMESGVGQSKALSTSPTAGNSAFLTSAFQIHSTSFSPILSKNRHRIGVAISKLEFLLVL